ncbi:MAG: hypothetical protein AB7T06_24360, partial [Kofleriaceae bacterium]
MRGAIALVLVGLAGCRCGGKPPPPPPVKDAAVAAPVDTPITEAESRAVLACLLQDSQSSREVLSVLGENLAPPALIRRAVDTALARAKLDG